MKMSFPTFSLEKLTGFVSTEIIEFFNYACADLSVISFDLFKKSKKENAINTLFSSRLRVWGASGKAWHPVLGFESC